MKLFRSPVTQFLILSVLTIIAITATTSILSGRAAEAEALAEARDTNGVLAHSVAEPVITNALLRGSNRGAVDQFAQLALDRLFIDQVRRINMWRGDGRLLFSSQQDLSGRTFTLSSKQRDIVAGGGTGSEFVDPADPENVSGTTDEADPSQERLVRIYTQVRAPNGKTALFEAYYSLSDIEERRAQIYASFRWISVGGPLLLVLLVTPLLVVVTRGLTAGAKERERLLNVAIDASDAERRRIARDLHDGVVQDLAGTAFSVSAVARHSGTTEESRARLRDAGSSLRDSLKALRSLLAEIHPPELHSEGLSAALEDLIAPSAALDVQASVSVEGAETASDSMAALVWRVAQEAVRNSLRHAHASTLAVTVHGDGNRISLEVVDDGVGFDPDDLVDPSRFGLRGLRSLVAECNGTLEVRSSPGDGTTVRMEVDAQ